MGFDQTYLACYTGNVGASLSLTLSKPLFLYLHKLKALKALSLYSPSFARTTSSPPMEALPQALVASSGKDGLCGGFGQELTLDAAQIRPLLLWCRWTFFSPRLS